jgi:tetratricopeptide (TPR) repeat protein
MIKVFFIFILSLVLTVYAQSEDSSLFYKANELYKEGKVDKALSLYQNIKDKSAHVYYNMGNCAYKLEKYGYAILYWRRAEKNWDLFDRSELLHNILFLKQQLKMGETPKPITTTKLSGIKSFFAFGTLYFFSLFKALPLVFFQLLFLLLWVILFSLLRLLFFYKKIIIIYSLFTITALSGISLAFKYNIENKNYGVTLTSTQVNSGPGENFQTVCSLPEGKEVVLGKKSGQYYKIGHLGWAKDTNIEQI